MGLFGDCRNSCFLTKTCLSSSYILCLFCEKIARMVVEKFSYFETGWWQKATSLHRTFNVLSIGVQYIFSCQWRFFGLKCLFQKIIFVFLMVCLVANFLYLRDLAILWFLLLLKWYWYCYYLFNVFKSWSSIITSLKRCRIRYLKLFVCWTQKSLQVQYFHPLLY